MPKERRYTRSELESLRRADLQNLYKINGLKGANASTDTLRETLLSHFASSSFVSPAKRTAGLPKKSRLVERGTAGAGVVKAPQRVEMKRRITAGTSAPAIKRTVLDRPRIAPVVQEIRPDTEVTLEAGPSRPTSPQVAITSSYLTETSAQIKLLDNRLTRLEIETTSTSGSVSESRVEHLLEERDRMWEARLAELEKVWATRVQEMEARLEERIQALLGQSAFATPRNPTSSTIPPPPQVTLTEDTPTNILGKRVQRSPSPDSDSEMPEAGPSRLSESPAHKRTRRDEPDHEELEDDSDVISPQPHTPSPPHSATLAVPRTPSPSHQGTLQDQSRTPGIASDFFAPPPQFGSSHKKRQASNSDSESELPYPLFATTPRPSEPLSPTLDAPPSSTRRRVPFPRAVTLTPGRRRVSPAPRAVSDAHKELHTITESDEPPMAVTLANARRRVASVDTPTLLSSALRGSSVPISPPQLSPSPSIGATEREGGFTYTPFPPVPRGTTSISRGAGRDRLTPVKQQQRAKSPIMDYMDVATYGLDESPSARTSLATPGHRTMLGTERYRDTRFGDVPVVSWGTPSVDLGPGTPATGRW